MKCEGHVFKKRADKSALFPFNLTLTKPMKKLSIFSCNKYTTTDGFVHSFEC